MSMKASVATCVAAMALAAVAPAAASAAENVNASCNGPVGITGTSTTHFTIPVEADANATSSDPGVVAVATTVRCQVKNTTTGTVYGTVSQGAPGPVVVAAGVLTVPIAPFQYCVTATAIFSNGRSVTLPATC